MSAGAGVEPKLVDNDAYHHAVERFRRQRIALPTFAQLSEPSTIPASMASELSAVARGAADPRNLFRVHWYNRADGPGCADVPEHLVLPPSLTGVAAPIVVLLGNRFPMVGSHKVLAAYACLAPRIVAGQFDPTSQRAVWPSTGNYARGGVAISAIMGCRGIAVLPENMSRARFDWLDSWVTDPADIIRTPGSESNVKEIYDRCDELAADPANVVFNQFSEFANHLVHWQATGRAVSRVFERLAGESGELRLRALVSASGSGGTIAAGDYLKERYGSLTVAVEALECPTMLYNGFGQHNIQGIGDKHIPLIQNVTNHDVVIAVSDHSTDALDVLFNDAKGAAWLAGQAGVERSVVSRLGDLGLSSICNLLAAIKLAKHRDLGPHDVIMTIATDGAELYANERAANVARFGGTVGSRTGGEAGGSADGGPGREHGASTRRPSLDDAAAARLYREHLVDVIDDHVLDLSAADRNRIFNLGYFTWVEQRGVTLDDFEARRDQEFWRGLRKTLPVWDEMISEFNQRTGVLARR